MMARVKYFLVLIQIQNKNRNLKKTFGCAISMDIGDYKPVIIPVAQKVQEDYSITFVLRNDWLLTEDFLDQSQNLLQKTK